MNDPQPSIILCCLIVIICNLLQLGHGHGLNIYSPCKTNPSGLYTLMYSGRCDKYIRCSDVLKGRTGFVYSCPAGENFDPTSGKCDRAFKCPTSQDDNHHSLSTLRNEVVAALPDIVRQAMTGAMDTLNAEMKASSSAGGQPPPPPPGGQPTPPGGGRRKRPFGKVQGFLGSSRQVKGIAAVALNQQLIISIIRDRFRLSPSQLLALLPTLPPVLQPNQAFAAPDAPDPPITEGICPYPSNGPINQCPRHSRYRTLDGSCNNLIRPLWGKSNRPLRRLLQPDYADGFNAPRLSARGRLLPNPRRLTAALFGDVENPSHLATIMHMRFGQFLDHDLDRTAISTLATPGGETVNIDCGEDGCSTQGQENRACLPIPIPADDPDFTTEDCLMFVRSEEGLPDDCRLGPRQQVNQITSWIDASNVYGSTLDFSRTLRDTSLQGRGKMNVTEHPYDNMLKNLLPQGEDPDCEGLNDTIRCFSAGDTRVNEHVALSSIHTIFMREHNRIEEELHRVNPHWTGDRLYQEARHILAAAWQFITYNEYLPTILGPTLTKQYGLFPLKYGYLGGTNTIRIRNANCFFLIRHTGVTNEKPDWSKVFWGYDQQINPDISNAFATAAFRFGHSQIANFIKFTDTFFKKNLFLHDSLFNVRPAAAYDTTLPGGSGVDAMMLGHISQASESVDRSFSKRITTQLFSEDPPNALGTDLVSLNIQRGRDHGLPGYLHWRKHCGLSSASSFSELKDIPEDARTIMESLYDDVSDIDLFVGGISERHVSGGLLGPTFACIIGQQFRDLKFGDRFWFERKDSVIGFRNDQLQEIRKWSLARVLCDNLDNITGVQRWALLQPFTEAIKEIQKYNYQELYSLVTIYKGDYNQIRSCDFITRPDLSKWKEFQL